MNGVNSIANAMEIASATYPFIKDYMNTSRLKTKWLSRQSWRKRMLSVVSKKPLRDNTVNTVSPKAMINLRAEIDFTRGALK